MAKDILNFKAPDLVNLQKWYLKSPREFKRAAVNVTNSLAFDARKQSVKNLQSKTKIRARGFVSRSLRVDKARFGTSLNQIVAEMGSIDISRAGRSSGFEELETGKKYIGSRVPTLASRGGQEKKKVAAKVRMNKQAKFFKRQMFKGKGRRTKQQQMVAMLKSIRQGTIGRDPFVIEGRQRGRMARMKPGVWAMGNNKRLNLMNPFRGKRRRTKAIHWQRKAVNKVTSDTHMKQVWSNQIDFVLSKR